MITSHPYFYIFLCVVLNVVSQLLLKTGMNTIGHFQIEANNLLTTTIRIATNPNIIIGLLLYGLSFALWLVALSRLDVSIAYPLLSIGYIIMPFVAYLFLGEVLSILKIVGICIIIAGVYIVSKS